MQANLLTHLLWMIVCQLVKYLFLRSFKRTVLLSWGIFPRIKWAFVRNKGCRAVLVSPHLTFQSVEPSHLLLSPSNLHNQITHLILSSVALDFLLSPHCYVWFWIFFTLIRSARTSFTTFTSRLPIRLREFLLHITFAEIFVLIYFYFHQLIWIPMLESFAHQVAWIKNKRNAKWSFSIVFTWS